MNQPLSLESIIVWQGMITRYGVIYQLPHDPKDIRLAIDKEIERYKKRP